MKQSMKRMVQLIIKYLCHGISWGCTCFVLLCLCCHFIGADDILALIWNDFAKHAAGSILVGVACGSTAIVYQIDRLPFGAKVLIHFTVGMGVFYPVALSLHWIPYRPGNALYSVLQFLVSCSIFAAIWFCFYLFNRSEAKKINNRLQELAQEQKNKSR